MSPPVTIPYRCEALIDQGRMIGSDPVGYACSENATLAFTDANGVRRYICAACAADFREHGGMRPGRVTLLPVSEDQAVIVARIVAIMKENAKRYLTSKTGETT